MFLDDYGDAAPYPSYTPFSPGFYEEPAPASEWNAGSIFDTVKAGANSLLDVWSDVRKAELATQTAEANASIQRARLQTQTVGALSGEQVAQARINSERTIELARAQAAATGASRQAFGGTVSPAMMAAGALLVGALLYFRKG